MLFGVADLPIFQPWNSTLHQQVAELNKDHTMTKSKLLVKLFLRLSIAAGFLSAVADRFGIWGQHLSTWGNWDKFVEYTQLINPWLPATTINLVAILATAAEVIFALLLIVGFKTELVARLSGVLLLLFALSMTLSTGIKGPFDYSVFTASAGAFALGMMRDKYLEVDSVITGSKYR
jgi:thiosulfate dehydrogenase [quinone] large subunit